MRGEPSRAVGRCRHYRQTDGQPDTQRAEIAERITRLRTDELAARTYSRRARRTWTPLLSTDADQADHRELTAVGGVLVEGKVDNVVDVEPGGEHRTDEHHDEVLSAHRAVLVCSCASVIFGTWA
jgi:hypothetical protein